MAVDTPIHETQTIDGYTEYYATMQPNNDDDRWNTCDADGDTYCMSVDLPYHESVVNNGMIDYSPIGSWAVTFYNQQPSYIVNQWNPFQLSVHADAGAGQSGRPGIIVKVKITGGTATGKKLSGRNCTPDYWGDPDQLNTGDDQCAVGVSISQWQGPTPAEGLTEDAADSYGLRVWADGAGTVNLHAAVNSIDSYLIPEFSADFTLQIIGGCDSVSLACPSPVNELVTSHCTIMTDGTCAVEKDSLFPDTCNGTITGNDYAFTPPESMGTGSCNAAVRDHTDNSKKDNRHVIVNEVNQAPYFSPQPTSPINIDSGKTYNSDNGTMRDDDLPNTASNHPGYVLCSLTPGSNTCAFTPVITGAGSGAPGTKCHINFPASGPPWTCQFGLRATDGWSPALTADSNLITVNVIPPPISWNKTSPSGTTGGVDGPVTPRVANNYPADWNRITLNFSGNANISASSVDCAAPRSNTYVLERTRRPKYHIYTLGFQLAE
jgi:hypothetical protein